MQAEDVVREELLASGELGEGYVFRMQVVPLRMQHVYGN